MVRFLKAFSLGCVIGFIADGCSTLAFTYKYYGLDAVSYDGTLLGPGSAQDLSLKLCYPTEKDRSPCVIMLRPEFLKLKGDYLIMSKQLSACQRQ